MPLLTQVLLLTRWLYFDVHLWLEIKEGLEHDAVSGDLPSAGAPQLRGAAGEALKDGEDTDVPVFADPGAEEAQA